MKIISHLPISYTRIFRVTPPTIDIEQKNTVILTELRCFLCEDKTIEMFLRFRCLDLNSCKLFHSMLLALKASTIGLIFIFPIFNEEA